MRNTTTAWTLISGIFLLAIWLIVAPGTPDAHAQATSPQRFEADAGPYHVVVDVLPPRPIVGELQFHVRPTLAATGATPTNPRVWVILGRRGLQEIKTPALRSPSDDTLYVGNAEIVHAGPWALLVSVSSADGEGEAEFEIEVMGRGRSGEGLVAPTMAFAGAAAAILAGVGWLILQSRRARRRLPPGS